MFFELIQITLGNREAFSCGLTGRDWRQLYETATKQSLASVLITGIERVRDSSADLNIPQALLFEWIGGGLQAETCNKRQNERSKELYTLFKTAGYRSAVLKGQGTAQYYPNPQYRACGDIDLWVEGDRDEILEFAKRCKYQIGSIDIKHAEIRFFDDVPVEIHFLPSWMYSPFTNRRLQRFFASKAYEQFSNIDDGAGFAHTTLDFDLVYSMVHIYRHIFSEGIGLRQLMDYYYILRFAEREEMRVRSFETLCSLGMGKFVGGVMWILTEKFGMDLQYALCPVNERHGKFLLSEIMTAGNFGHYDDRTKQVSKDKKFKRGFVQLGRNLRFVSYYPSEVLWSPFWKLWHWCWRKRKGYL